jgi:hypothetical protein
MDVQRLLEKYFADIRHVETERHWLLGVYAVIVAGAIALLVEIQSTNHRAITVAVLLVLSVVGLLHTLRATLVLRLIQDEIKAIVEKWQSDPGLKCANWPTHWKWPTMRGIKPSPDWLLDLIPRVFPPYFTAIHTWVYFAGAGLFGYVLFVILT